MKKLIATCLLVSGFLVLTTSCEESTDPCACYDKAIGGGDLSEECKTIVGEMTEEELKEKANECLGQLVEDLSGAAGM